MKVAVIGSRTLTIDNIGDFIPSIATEIVSGGAKGIDQSAREYAHKNCIELTEFLPDYRRYGRSAPLKRNLQIIEYADFVVAFWDQESKGTKFVIEKCKDVGKPVRVIRVDRNPDDTQIILDKTADVKKPLSLIRLRKTPTSTSGTPEYECDYRAEYLEEFLTEDSGDYIPGIDNLNIHGLKIESIDVNDGGIDSAVIDAVLNDIFDTAK